VRSDEHFADALYRRFPPELKVATDAWLETNPLNNLAAPATPYQMPAYRLPQQDEARQFDQIAARESTKADGRTSDRTGMYY
jgi:hypothetical protein